MNLEELQRLILLEQSGELNLTRKLLLRRYMSKHPELKGFRRDVLRIADLSRGLPEGSDVSEQTMATIHTVASETILAQRSAILGATSHASRGAWRALMALAALLCMAAAVWLTYLKPVNKGDTTGLNASNAQNQQDEWYDELDGEIAKLGTMMRDNGYSNVNALPEEEELAKELVGLEDSDK